ncbi:MAG: GTP-binding protein [Geodermatophilaceae bacterium]
MLYDSKSIFEDQYAAIEDASRRRGEDAPNLALLTDGLRAEREQGITIDVAYRYFATPKRAFILADTPGHPQYTRNMVTGASTANLALVLVDARNGIVEQSRRHAFLATLLRVPHLVLCVNKMDLVDYDQGVFESIKEEFEQFASRLDIGDLTSDPGLGAERRQCGHPLRQHAVVRRLRPAASPRGGLHRLRPQPHRCPLPGAVRHPPPQGLPPRLPGVRRNGGRRSHQGR